MGRQLIDTNPAGNKIGVVPEERATRGASRYDAVIATFVGVCALCVSGYTAYMQRQQVRAAVWRILEFDSSNAPDIHFTLANKGVLRCSYGGTKRTGRLVYQDNSRSLAAQLEPANLV